MKDGSKWNCCLPIWLRKSLNQLSVEGFLIPVDMVSWPLNKLFCFFSKVFSTHSDGSTKPVD
jgi:hypothetical protein